MNINSSFKNIEEIKTFLGEFNRADWNSEELSPNAVQKFITNNLKILANSQDKELHDHLMTLSDRISKEWSRPEANILAFEIMGIAKGVFNEGGEQAPKLLDEMWQEIFSKIPPRAPGTPNIPEKKGGIESGLKDVYPSKKLSDIARNEEEKWVGAELVSLKIYGCQTAKDAVQYAIDHKLTGANLSEYPDLDETELKRLFENCPTLSQLNIKSNKIISLPMEAKALTALNCSGCMNLQNLRELPKVQKLECVGCEDLKSLPELPLVEILNCSKCENLQSLPELPQVKMLDCSYCKSLQILPDLPLAKILNCSTCKSLQSLPKLPMVEKLYCPGCENLQSLPELHLLQVLDCSNCNLQSLPELPQLQQLHCWLCNKLQSLPELPQVVTLFCPGCENLQSLGQLPQVKLLECSNCTSLESLPELPKVQQLGCMECVQLRSLPELPEGVQVQR